jgi:hypothetical protein
MIVINSLDSLYSRLPNLGTELRHLIVSILPFLAIIFGVLITFAGVMDIIGTPFLSMFSASEGAGVFRKLMLVNVLGIIQGLLMIFAFRHLRKRRMRGWNFLFWSQIIWIISALITLSPSFLLGFVFLYPLFQVRDSYK